MRLIEIIMIVITGILLFSTVVCGLWIRFSGQEVEVSSLNFHMILGILTAIATVITIILLLVNRSRA